MTKLILIRGLPGSGKSTMAKDLTGYVHLESDMYHVNGDGIYEYHAEHVKAAHAWCQQTCLTFLRNGVNVVVSNTFTQKWEMAPYLLMKDYCKDLDIEVSEASGNFGNVHNVPDDVIERMKTRWEKL